jgi:hypothetical protein
MVISDNPRATGLKRFTSTSFGAPDRFRSFFMERYGESYRLEIEAFVGGWLMATGAGQCPRRAPGVVLGRKLPGRRFGSAKPLNLKATAR